MTVSARANKMRMKNNPPNVDSSKWKTGSPVRTVVEGKGIIYAAEKTA